MRVEGRERTASREPKDSDARRGNAFSQTESGIYQFLKISKKPSELSWPSHIFVLTITGIIDKIQTYKSKTVNKRNISACQGV